ncbi:MAG: alkaline phosphatase [Proteobacteria bacterium]|nr:alkaline phosphatase [Pseudomonadota bacterium]MBU4296119.1 alkaline phosphatase [Pseudomonadota bacterium]MCG2746732.1 alkaline phosphatase [Desulfobulbaceae bacterium]
MMRVNNVKFLCMLALLLLLAGAGCAPQPTTTGSTSTTRNIILFIGDGMGQAQRQAARLSAVGDNGRLAMDDMPATGLLHTAAADNPVTDSAAGATAMACGVKTNVGVIGLDASLIPVATILERAKSQGKLTGLVTTTPITDATPAAFAAHIRDRTLSAEIAVQLLNAEVDVMLGGGEDAFLPTDERGCYEEPGKRTDNRNIIRGAVNRGSTWVCDAAALAAVDPTSARRLLGLFADQGMTRPFSPSLAEMTQKAIDILTRGPNGFFLMVEAGQIDWAAHTNDAEHAIADTIDLDRAVKIARHYAAKNNNTLIIVTADHETGGMTISRTTMGLNGEDGPFPMAGGGKFYVNWSTIQHTPVDVPVTAMGPGAKLLNGVHDNTFVYEVMDLALSE